MKVLAAMRMIHKRKDGGILERTDARSGGVVLCDMGMVSLELWDLILDAKAGQCRENKGFDMSIHTQDGGFDVCIEGKEGGK